MSRSGVHPRRTSDSFNSMLLSKTGGTTDRAAARPADVSRREALLREERDATGGDEQLFFHEAPPWSRVLSQRTKRGRCRQPHTVLVTDCYLDTGPGIAPVVANFSLSEAPALLTLSNRLLLDRWRP